MGPLALHEDDVASLISRARARERFPDLGFDDPWAEELLSELEFAPRPYEETRLRVSMVRTMLIDGIVRHFFQRHPGGLGIGIHPGLCTRFSRIDNGELRWVDFDPAPVAKLKSKLYRTPERHMVAACCSLGCTGWMDLFREARDMPVLIIAECARMRADFATFDTLLTRLTTSFGPGTEFVFGHDARSPLRPSSTRPGASLEVPGEDGVLARYPSVRFVPREEYAPELAHEMAGLDGASRLFRGRGMPSVVHLRLTGR